jgi:hypothetical protein
VINIEDFRLKTIPFIPAFKHRQDCLVMQDGPCTCGLEEVLEDEAGEELEEVLKEKLEKSMKAPQKSLKNWTDQKWRTKSGKPSTQGSKATGERYLPESAIKSLSPSEYAATSRAKRAGKAKGKQFVKQPKSIARKTAGFR